MGGIAAVLGARETAPSAAARRMLEAAPHRGESIEVVEIGSCALGVQDGPRGGDAGLAAANGWAIAFTGAIDNLESLKAGIAGLDADAPAEILLAAAIRYGDDLPLHTRGPFAAAFTDGNRLLWFRDHLGFKSAFYRCDGAGVLVGSEAKQVVAGAGIAPEPDMDVVRRLFFRDARETLPSALRGVDRLEQATIAECDGRSIRTRRYWDPKRLLESARLTHDEIRDQFDELMATAVERSITGSDVVLLSGGIDSPAVAAYAAEPFRRLTGRPLPALSYVYPETPSADEREYIEQVADYLGLDLHLDQPQADPLQDLVEWVRLADGPVALASIPHYAESYRLARALGADNILTGELAEFLISFSGSMIQHLTARGRVGPALRHFVAARRGGVGVRRLAREVAATFVPPQVSAARARADARGIPPWINPRAVTGPFAESVGWIGRRWTVEQVAAFYGTSSSMVAEEICQQVCGVRVRRPWADIDLWEFFLSLRAEDKHPYGLTKELVRRLLRGRLPDSILDRRDKTVFDESVLKRINYGELSRWLSIRDYRLPGIDYELLERRVGNRELTALEYMWAKDLAGVHAFLSQW